MTRWIKGLCARLFGQKIVSVDFGVDACTMTKGYRLRGVVYITEVKVGSMADAMNAALYADGTLIGADGNECGFPSFIPTGDTQKKMIEEELRRQKEGN